MRPTHVRIRHRDRGASRGARLASVAALAAGLALPVASRGQSIRTVPNPTAIESTIAEVPFGPGERAEYEVKLGIISVGDAVMYIPRVDRVRGRPSYYVLWTIEGGLLFARVSDRYESWMDIETLSSHRFVQDVDEVNYERVRVWEIDQEQQRWELTQYRDRRRRELGQPDTTIVEDFSTPQPLDDLSFIYYVRTLPLEVGETYTMDNYFRDDRNPVTLRVLRRETIEVPAGVFETIVVQPIIKAGGLFGEGGRAEVYFTDDDRRLLVRLSTRGIPLLGDLSLHLKSFQAGTPLRRD